MGYRKKVFSEKYMVVHGVLYMTPADGIKLITKRTNFVPDAGWNQEINGLTWEKTYRPTIEICPVRGKIIDCPSCREFFGEKYSKHLEK